MTRYRYSAVGRDGAMVKGRVSAATPEQAGERLISRGVVPVTIQAARRGGGGGFARRQDLALFTRELAMLLDARVPIDRALQALAEAAQGETAGRVAATLRSELRAGRSLSEAMGDEGLGFPDFYVGLVQAGEASGALAEVFERLADMIEKSEALRAKLRGALTYPAFVLGLTILTLLILLVFVVPQFATLFGDGRTELPLQTRLVLGASDGLRSWGWLGAAVIAGAVTALLVFRRTEAMKRLTDVLLLRLPGLGRVVRMGAGVRYCRALGTMIQNGVELTEAVRIARRTLDNVELARALSAVDAPLAAGRGLAEPLRDTGLLPPMVVHIVAVGEESGRLPEMLLRTADMVEAEVERRITRFMSLLTPVVMLVLGGVIAVVIGSILSAMLQSYNLAL